MSYKWIFITWVITSLFAFAVKAQDRVMDDVASIKPMVSTREDVIKKFSQIEIEGSSVWLYLPDESIEFFFSNGECREDWIAPVDTVVLISIFFRKDRPISALTAKVDLIRLRKTNTLDGDKIFHDDKNGIRYGVDAQEKFWTSMTYYPPKNFVSCKC